MTWNTILNIMLGVELVLLPVAWFCYFRARCRREFHRGRLAGMKEIQAIVHRGQAEFMAWLQLQEPEGNA
jgi:hypothetical protein